MSIRTPLALVAIIVCTSGRAESQDAASFPQPYNTQPETDRLLTPQEALAAIKVPEGFHVSLFAAEPDVQNPIALCTDSRGRLWVAENYTYAEQAVNFTSDLRDRIVILADTNGDGTHDLRTVFFDQADKLTGIAVGFGGVWATCAPNLLFIPDRNGDDVPDGPPEVLLNGFDQNEIRHNIVNGLEWGPDGWLYGRHGITTNSKVGPPGCADSERITINCGVWRYHPTRRVFEPVTSGTTNPWGMDWDPHGEFWLINTVIGHLWHVVPGAHWERMYGSDFNPHYYQLMPQTADHVHWDTGETWSEVRKGMSSTTEAAGGGHAHCGLLACDRSWPEEYQGSVLAGNLHGRRLNRDVLHRDGCAYHAHHAPDFLTTSDPYFRIIELEHARDGGMYIADWSDIGECHENDGVHRTSGRIYKLTWDGLAALRQSGGTGTVPTNDLASLSNEQLVGLQGRPDEWYPRTARRLLQERAAAGQDLSAAGKELRRIVEEQRDPVQIVRALWGLDVIGRVPRDLLAKLVQSHSDEHVRAWALRIIVGLAPTEPATADLLAAVAIGEASGLVRLYAASSLQRLKDGDRMRVADRLARRAEDAHDRYQPLMVWYGIEPIVLAQPQAALQLAAESALPLVSRFIARRLTEQLKSQPDGVEQLVALLGRSEQTGSPLKRELLQGMTDALNGWRQAPMPPGWDQTGALLAKSGDADVVRLGRELSVVFGDGRAVDELKDIVNSGKKDVPARRAALRALVEARAEGVHELLLKSLDNRDLAPEAVRGLAAMGGAETPRALATRYGRLKADAREEAIATLVCRPDFAPALLDAVAEGKVPRDAVVSFQLRQMLTYGNESLSRRIHELWPELTQLSQEKQSRIRQLTGQLTPETIAAADTPHGRLLFQNACAKCHKLFGEGGTAAPELTGAQRTNLTYLLENIVDPSATISKNYKMSVVILDDGRVLNGVVLDPTERTITLQMATEKMVIDRESIDELRETELSLMPEGQLDRLSPAEVRDLIGYLMSPAQVELRPDATAGSQ